MTRVGSIAEPGNGPFAILRGAPSPRSARRAGEDVQTRRPRQVGNLARAVRRASTSGRRLPACPKGLQQAETRRMARTCRSASACRPRRHGLRVWRRWPGLANVRFRSTVTIRRRSAQCSGIAASHGRKVAIRPPRTRPQGPCLCQKEIREFQEGVDFSPPEGPELPGDRRDAHSEHSFRRACRVPAGQFRPRVASGVVAG